jgi:PAB-dependent poly(A)-specific ribonuclease subunit 2
MAIRRGHPLWHITYGMKLQRYIPWLILGNYSHDDMKDLRCMSYTSRGTSEILVAGLQDQMFIIDVDKGTVTKQVAHFYVRNDHY